jgi:hypothetical protein
MMLSILRAIAGSEPAYVNVRCYHRASGTSVHWIRIVELGTAVRACCLWNGNAVDTEFRTATARNIKNGWAANCPSALKENPDELR